MLWTASSFKSVPTLTWEVSGAIRGFQRYTLKPLNEGQALELLCLVIYSIHVLEGQW